MARLKFFTFVFLLLLPFISSTKSVDPQQLENVEQGEPNGAVTGTNPLADPQSPKNAVKRKKEEMAAVGDNISAVYIVRNIERATALNASVAYASKEIMVDLHLRLHDNYEIKIDALEVKLKKAKTDLQQTKTAQQQLTYTNQAKALTEKIEAVKILESKLIKANEEQKLHKFWMLKINESILLDEEIKSLIDQLADALKEEKKVENYLKYVDSHIVKFREQKKIAKESEDKHPDMNAYKKCHKFCVDHLDFLEQIWLELQLYYEFKLKPKAEPDNDSKNNHLPASGVFTYKDLQAFMENAQNLEKLNKDNLGEKVVKQGNPIKKFLSSAFSGKNSKKVVVEKSEFASNNGHSYQALVELNNAAEKLYIEIAKVIEWPFKDETIFVGSILDVGQILEKAEDKKGLHPKRVVNAKNYLENLFNMYEAVQSILQSLTPKWYTELYGKIHGKVEMPREWYSEMYAAAYPNIPQGKYELTEVMVHLRVKLLLAKILLVYERLEKFYKIGRPYNVWKKDKENRARENGAEPKLGDKIYVPLLKPFFDEFEQKKQPAVPSASPVHDQHDPTSQHG